MDILLYTIALTMAILGLVGSLLPVLPGPIFSFLALLSAFVSPRNIISGSELFWWGLACLVITVADYILPPWFTKKLGGTKYGVWGATIGMIVGLIAFPPFGMIWGSALGAIMGEMLKDKNDPGKAFVVGMASLLAFVVGTGAKFVLSILIFVALLSALAPEIAAAWDWFLGLFM